MVYLYNRNSEKNIYVLDTEFYRIPRGMGTDGKPITSESWKHICEPRHGHAPDKCLFNDFLDPYGSIWADTLCK